VRQKASAYAIALESVDGMDVQAVAGATTRAADAVRRGDGPRFIEFQTYRFRAHSMFDPELYRDKAEVEEWKKRDPIFLVKARLEQEGALGAPIDAIEADVAREIASAVAFAEAGTWEPVEHLTTDVYTTTAR
jgi:pyruvate dehydrogenase E1 component alpha subunit